jgi:hypothetical protein
MMGNNGMQRVPMMTTYPTIYVPTTITRYPIFVRNYEILAILVGNGSFHNKICTKPLETIEGHHFNGFKPIPISYGVQKSIVVNLDVEC